MSHFWWYEPAWAARSTDDVTSREVRNQVTEHKDLRPFRKPSGSNHSWKRAISTTYEERTGCLWRDEGYALRQKRAIRGIVPASPTSSVVSWPSGRPTASPYEH